MCKPGIVFPQLPRSAARPAIYRPVEVVLDQALGDLWLITAARTLRKRTMSVGPAVGELMDVCRPWTAKKRPRQPPHGRRRKIRAFSALSLASIILAAKAGASLPLVLGPGPPPGTVLQKRGTSGTEIKKCPQPTSRSSAIATSAWRTSTRQDGPTAAHPLLHRKVLRRRVHEDDGSGMETERGIMITSAANCTCFWTAGDAHINIIDTPCMLIHDRRRSSLRVLDARSLLDGDVAGVERQSELSGGRRRTRGSADVLHQQARPTGANFDMRRPTSGLPSARVRRCSILRWLEGQFKGLVDLVENRAITPCSTRPSAPSSCLRRQPSSRTLLKQLAWS